MRWQLLLPSVVSAALLVGAASSAQAQQKTATKSAQKSTNEVAKKPDQTPTKAAKTDDKAVERRAFAKAEAEPAELLKGLKLTKTERAQVNSVERKYRKELADLRKSHDAAVKAKKEDNSQIAAQVQAIADRERDELRGLLTPAQQATFDKNAGKLK
jgi:hypothetical protein